MKPISCMYITGGLVTVLAISLYFAYKKKQEEIQELARARAEAVARASTREPFRGYGGGGIALRNGGGGTAGGPAAEYASVSPVENF
jgi:hypothetical protein